MKTISAMAAILLLAGCATTGTRVDDAAVDKFTPGVTTEADVTKALGAPQYRSRNSDGTTMVMYNYAHTQVKGATFIPVVGLFAGGVKADMTNARFTFDANGKLTDTSNGGQQFDVKAPLSPDSRAQ